MYAFAIFSISVIFLGHSSAISPNCTALKDVFASSSAEFAFCAINNARPISLCMNCTEIYSRTLSSYKNMSAFADDDGNCLQNYVNLDRFEIVSYVYEQNKDVWLRANCSGCFRFEGDSLIERNETKEFFKLRHLLYECVHNKTLNNTNLCVNCKENYEDLNNYYNYIQEDDSVCADIIDAMNITRVLWSKKCVERNSQDIIFLCTASLVLFFTLVFYISIKFLTDKKLSAILPQNRFYESINQFGSRN